MRELGVIEQRIKDDSTAALKAGDKRRREALSSFVAALKKERIDSRREPTEADELTVLKRERKRRAEAIELYDTAGRRDLADRERYEEELLASYMPEELSDAALEELVGEAIAATDAVTPKDMGRVMGWLKPKVAGRADGKRLSGMVREKLGG
ncbi:MAG: GatB/YqeY domain-containing protein [Actinobacteria bacterium]|nr:GatB/YqeY domain-containing protein [Actinomycetota bacterium]